MARSPGRSRSVIVAAATAGLLVAATAVPAGAAEVPAFYGGTTTANVVKLVLTLPGQEPLGVGLISANGSSLFDPKGLSAQPQSSHAFAGLASGTLVEGTGPLSPLNRSVVATLEKPSPDASNFLALPGNPLGLAGSAGDLTAKVTGGSGSNASAASLATVSLGSLTSLLANLPAEVTKPVQAGIADGSTQISDGLKQVLDALTPVTGPAGAGDPTGTLQGVIDTVNGVVANLPASIAQVQNKPIVSLGALRSAQSITQTGDGVKATATTKLASLNLLGGFVTLDGFENTATAFANGVAGGATAVPQPAVAKVVVANDLAVLGLDVKGVRAQVGSIQGVPAEVVAAVNTALDAVEAGLKQVFDATGVSITQSAGTNKVSPDGREATAAASGLLINLAPGGTQLLSLEIGAASATALAQQPVVPPVVPPVEPPVTPNLPKTGAELPLTGGAALLLLAGAVAVRRRGLFSRD